MAQVINTNVSSLNAQRNLNASQSSLATSLQRLSTGLRINSAKDDAAGLAISDRMTSQVRGLNQAARNANDGISLAQTAESGLGEVGANLQRMRELAVQSANSTNTASDRAALQAEVSQLLQEIQRVSTTTQFNGQNILDGTFTAAQFQVGANANQTIIANTGNAQTNAIGSYQVNTNTLHAVSGQALQGGQLVINGTDIGRSTSGTAESLATAINAAASKTGVTATARTEQKSSLDPKNVPLANQALQSGDLVINGVNIGAVAGDKNAALQGRNIAAAINGRTSETGVTATADAATGALTLTSATGKDIHITSHNAAEGGMRVENATGLEMVGDIERTVDFTGKVGKSQVVTITAAHAAGVAGSTLSVAGESFLFVTDGTAKAPNEINIGTDSNGLAANIRAALKANDNVMKVANIGEDVTAPANVVITSKVDETAAAHASTVAGTGTLAVNTSLGEGTATVGGAAANTGVVGIESAPSAKGGGHGIVDGSTIDIGGRTYEFVSATLANRHVVGKGNIAVQINNATPTAAGTLANLAAAVNAEYAAGRSTAQIAPGFVSGSSTSFTVKEAKSFGSTRLELATGVLQQAKMTAQAYSNAGAKTAIEVAREAMRGKTLSIAGKTFTYVDTVERGKEADQIAISAVANDQATNIKTAITAAIANGSLKDVAINVAGSTNADVVLDATSAAYSTSHENGILKLSTSAPSSGLQIDTTASKAGVGVAIGDTVKVGGVTYEFGLASQASASVKGNVLVKLGVGTTASDASKATTANLAVAINEQYQAGNSTVKVSDATGNTISLVNVNYGSQKVVPGATEPLSNGSGGYLRAYNTSGSDGGYSTGNMTHGTLTLNSANNYTIEGTNTVTAGLHEAAVQMSTIDKIDISSVEGANAAISLIDGALAQVASTRADLGALQNRFSSVVSSLNATSENLSAARSRIQDADFAQETAALSRNQILQQAGIAMLRQANALPQNVLSLLK